MEPGWGVALLSAKFQDVLMSPGQEARVKQAAPGALAALGSAWASHSVRTRRIGQAVFFYNQHADQMSLPLPNLRPTEPVSITDGTESLKWKTARTRVTSWACFLSCFHVLLFISLPAALEPCFSFSWCTRSKCLFGAGLAP